MYLIFFFCGNAVLPNSEIWSKFLLRQFHIQLTKFFVYISCQYFVGFRWVDLKFSEAYKKFVNIYIGYPLCDFWNISVLIVRIVGVFLSRRIFTKSMSLELSKDKYSSGGALLKIRQLNYSFAVHSERNCSNWMFYVSFSPRSGKVGTSCSVGVVLRK